jgi:hypothetical protein
VRLSLRLALLAATAAGSLAGLPAVAGTWTALAHLPPGNVGAVLLLTDGTVIAHDMGSGSGGSAWYKLTPDSSGSYQNGAWTTIASLPNGYKPLYFGSAVLPDGRVIVEGGEYNGQPFGVWTTKGAIYDPLADTWKSVSPPSGWTSIGDAQSVVLDDGTYMLANCCTTQQATLNPSTLTWTATGTGKADINDEEGWTLLAGGKVLTVDANNLADLNHTEIFSNGTWTSAGDTPVKLPDTNSDGSGSHELGPAVLLNSGGVLAMGATGHNAGYNPKTGAWITAPDFPAGAGGQLDSADGPAVLLTSGNVLAAVSPGVFQSGTQFYEFNGSSWVAAPAFPGAANDSSFQVSLLLLPNGQVMATDFSKNVYLYTSSGKPKPAWSPKVTSIATTLTRGNTYTLSGKQLNGLSQAVSYGDDYQAATNYPIVRITNTATGHVFYARTANHSSMAVHNPAVVSTSVTIPAAAEAGASTLVVIANGIPSAGVAVTIQ